jgi:hypothetical protein
MTNGRPARKRPAGWSPFAGIARIRSLGVAVQPLRCPASQPSRRDSGYPAVGAVQLPRSPRRQYRRCMARRTGAQGRKPRMHGPNVVSPAQAQAPIRPHTRCPVRRSWPPAQTRRLRTVRVSGGNPRPRGTAAFMLPRHGRLRPDSWPRVVPRGGVHVLGNPQLRLSARFRSST